MGRCKLERIANKQSISDSTYVMAMAMMMEGWVFLDPHRLWGASIPVRAKVQMVHWIVNISMVSRLDFLDGGGWRR